MRAKGNKLLSELFVFGISMRTLAYCASFNAVRARQAQCNMNTAIATAILKISTTEFVWHLSKV